MPKKISSKESVAFALNDVQIFVCACIHIYHSLIEFMFVSCLSVVFVLPNYPRTVH